MASRKARKRGTAGRPPSPETGAVEAVARVRKFQEHKKIHDSALGKMVGVNQSSVHRALSRKPPRFTPTLRRLCDYAIIASKIDDAPRVDSAREQLTRAVEGVWDGSPEGLNRLLALLRDLGALVSRG